MRNATLGGFSAGVVVIVLLATGCGGDDTASPQPSAGSTPSSPSAPTEPTTPAAPESSYASFTPATGVTLTSSITSIQAPADWGDDPTPGENGAILTGGPDGDLRYGILQNDIVSERDPSTDAQANLSIKTTLSAVAPTRQPDEMLAGLPAYHLAGPDSLFNNYVDEIGIQAQGHAINIRVSTPKKLSAAEREQIVGTIMASFKLTG